MNLGSDTTRLILYSSPIGTKDTTYLTYFRLTGKHYSYLDRDRNGSSYDGIVGFQNFDLSSSGNTIIDPLAGLSTAFSVTELEDFF